MKDASPSSTRSPWRRAGVIAGLLLALALSLVLASRSAFVQDRLTERLATARLQGSVGAQLDDDGLHVIVCGSGSPLPNPERAQACVVVFAGGRGYVFDIGIGSAGNMGQWRLPAARIKDVFLTHFHSDHIGDLYELNLQGWTLGRGQPLRVHGPPGVETVVEGFQKTYSLDRRYRVQHHGELLPAEHGDMVAAPFAVREGSEVVLEDGDLRILAFAVDHSPIEPAVGYRVDYRGRSVVISGDTAPTPSLVEAYKDADILLHEALAPHVVSTLERAAGEADQGRLQQILRDIPDYHTTPAQAAELANQAKVRKLVLYHLVPGPPSFPPIAEWAFLRGVSDLRSDVTLAYDGATYSLPVGSDAILERAL